MLVHMHKNGVLIEEKDAQGIILRSSHVVEEFCDESVAVQDESVTEVVPTPDAWIEELLGIENSIRSQESHDRLRQGSRKPHLGFSWKRGNVVHLIKMRQTTTTLYLIRP